MQEPSTLTQLACKSAQIEYALDAVFRSEARQRNGTILVYNHAFLDAMHRIRNSFCVRILQPLSRLYLGDRVHFIVGLDSRARETGSRYELWHLDARYIMKVSRLLEDCVALTDTLYVADDSCRPTTRNDTGRN